MTWLDSVRTRKIYSSLAFLPESDEPTSGSYQGRSVSSQIHRVHDTDNGRIEWAFGSSGRHGCRFAFEYHQDTIPLTGTDGIYSQKRAAVRLSFQIHRLHQEKLPALDLVVFVCGNHRSHHFPDDQRFFPLRCWTISMQSTFPTMLASAGTLFGKKTKDASLPRT